MTAKRFGLGAGACCWAGALLWAALAARAESPAETNAHNVVLLTFSGTVEVAVKASEAWNPGTRNEVLQIGDHIRTGKNSRATLRLSDLSISRLFELTTLEIQAPQKPTGTDTLNVESGAAYFFNRDRPMVTQFRTPSTSGAIRGTEFNLAVAPDGMTRLALLDGQVELTNGQGSVELTTGEEAVVEKGKAPRKSPLLDAVSVIQWTLYYPGVLDVDELELDADAQKALATSLAAYRAGDLLAALAQYPAQGAPVSDAARVYHAAVLLAVGEVDGAQALLGGSLAQPRSAALAGALREMIAAVKHQPWQRTNARILATEWLAGSYLEQSQGHLAAALDMASKAAARSPGFGFAEERVAELQFSYGQTERALAALGKALAVSPRNAKALALQGFVFCARSEYGQALRSFQEAIDVDGSLGDAWLGRGLVRIRKGDADGGRLDLEIAASLEPTRSLLRSYLGKAFLNAGDMRHALRELELARRLDPADPTPWLYEALMDYQDNRTTEALEDLEKSADLNGNRQVYRSKLLLDQDRAVAGTSLAKIYQDAGMNEASVSEAAEAVNYDYANYSAHLFLADSLNALRDPTRFNLRYETAWFNELLLANLLAPPGARTISQDVSQQEYSRLLESDGMGLDLTSQYRSDRQTQELASQYGAFGGTSYSLDLTYQHNDGTPQPYRTNNALSDIEWYSQIKRQLGPNDALMVITKYENYHSGDNFQYNYTSNASPYFHYNEFQTPIAVGAWHHEWGPGVHTLALAGRLASDQNFTDQSIGIPVMAQTKGGIQPFFTQLVSNYSLANNLEIYTAELNQLIQGETHTTIFGARYQEGSFNTQDQLSGVFDPASFPMPPAATNIVSPFRRVSAYAYHNWEVTPSLLLTAGATYDALTYPDNFRFTPINSGEAYRQALSPKLALTWRPLPGLTFRGAYCQALGGASFDESFTLEPTELAGFNQSFRSVISESLVGSVAGPRYQVLGGAMDARLQSHTFLTLQVQYLESDLNEDVGVYYHVSSGVPPPPNFEPGTAPEELRYREPSVSLTVNQLLGAYVAAGAGYSYARSTLNLSDAFILGLAPYPVEQDELEAQLHKVSGYLQLTHPLGFYARAEVQWYRQFNSGYVSGTFDQPLPETDFSQVNFYVGWRFLHRRADATFGVLNVGGRDYSLNPLNVYNELPRSRVYMGRLLFNF